MVLSDGANIRQWKGTSRPDDEYLEFCKAEGKSPDVPFKGNFNVRVPQDLHQRAALYAEEHQVSLLNAVVQDALREYLSTLESQRPPNPTSQKRDVGRFTAALHSPLTAIPKLHSRSDCAYTWREIERTSQETIGYSCRAIPTACEYGAAAVHNLKDSMQQRGRPRDRICLCVTRISFAMRRRWLYPSLLSEISSKILRDHIEAAQPPESSQA